MPCWAALTFAYASTVLHRFLVLHQRPGLPTFAGFAAVLTVWLEWFAVAHPSVALRLSVLICLATTLAVNLALIAISILVHHAVPATRSLFTALLFGLLVIRARDVAHTRSPLPRV